MKKIVTGAIDNKPNIYRDKRLQKTFYWDLNQKRLRTTAVDNQWVTQFWFVANFKIENLHVSKQKAENKF